MVFAQANAQNHSHTFGSCGLNFLSVAWPQDVQEVSILGYSMGRLLPRSEMHYGAQAHHG